MQTRVAFNSGEFSPEMACRSDLDQYGRGCSVLENWQVSQMGGIKRRKGMRYVADAISSNSRLIPYIYSYADTDGSRFLVEISGSTVRVLNEYGIVEAAFESEVYYKPDKIRYFQQNKLLFITSIDNPPMVLEFDGANGWSFHKWEFKHIPWRYVNELRKWPIEVSKSGENYNVLFPDDVPDDESWKGLQDADFLRASFWTEQQEERSEMDKVLGIYYQADDTGKLSPYSNVFVALVVPNKADYGDKFATYTEESKKYWVCTAADGWNADNYVDGLESPANYSGAFAPAEDIEGFESLTAYYSIKDVPKTNNKIPKGTKIAIKQGYWEYYTCIKDFPGAVDGKSAFADYPGYFMRGLPVGEPVPCRGKWSFYCSGVWFGSYEVRRCYDTDALSGEWEDRGISFSRNDAASNTSISGTEEDEECYLRLFITRSRRMSATNLIAGFPQDGCSNRLIVEGYKHDTVLRAIPVKDADKNVTGALYLSLDKIKQDWRAYRTVSDWSWAAFSGRYGYPLHCTVFQQRLVFAATEAQPLTVWFSRIDDIDNFLVGNVDDAAMTLTLSAPSQNPICWMQSQDDRLMLGTSTTEYTIGSSSQNLAFSASTARARSHSHVGSNETAAIAAINKAVFVERGSTRVHEYGWNEESGGYIPRELSVFAPHIGADHGGLIYPTLMTKPDVVLVWTLGDGQLALCTYNNLQEVRAWHRWKTDGKILAACAMPDGNHEDKLYLVVERETREENGIITSTSVNIEVVDKDSPYVDCDTCDYASTIVTNALFAVMEERVYKRNNNGFYLRFGSPFEYQHGNMEVSVDGGEVWRYPDWLNGTVDGWKEVRSDATWHFEKQAGIRVSGTTGCHILGLQG